MFAEKVTSQSTQRVIRIYSIDIKRKVQKWETRCMGPQIQMLSTGRNFTQFSVSASSTHTDRTEGKGCGVWLSGLNLKTFQTQITTKLPVAFRDVWQRSALIDKNILSNSLTGNKSRLLWWAHLLRHTSSQSRLKSTHCSSKYGFSRDTGFFTPFLSFSSEFKSQFENISVHLWLMSYCMIQFTVWEILLHKLC